MPNYAVYGGCLRSVVPIPELRPMGGERDPSWVFEIASGEAPILDSAHVVGQDELLQDVHATLLRAPTTVRLQFDDTGIFDVRDEGNRIVWYPKDGAQPDVARADLVGRVLPLVQHDRGLLALHASAVCIDGQAIGFMAPKNYGKSSLAMSLVTGHGGKLLTDDTLIVSPSTGVAAPGVHSVRLWSETASRFDGLGAGRQVLSEKQIFEQLPDESLEFHEAPIAALYTLVPTPGDSPAAVRREALDGFAATMAIVQYQKLGALLAGQDAARVFDKAASLATRTPVYTLEVARDFARLPDAAQSLVHWHSLG
ncbi:MAG TPA: hypothetical protein VH762_13120 [Gemmatimonadaceae bacterium]